MKNFIKKSLVGAAAIASTSVFAGTANVTLVSGGATNLLAFNANLGSVVIREITVAASGASNTTVAFYDGPTNLSLAYSWTAYTNSIRYATNITTYWTNFYGVVQTNTPTGSNLVLETFTNNVVPAGTNLYPVRMVVSSAAGTTTTYSGPIGSGLGIPFINGINVTNLSSGTAVITILW